MSEGAAIELAELVWKNSYWSRLWIVQEVILASNIIIHHGQHRLLWESSLALISRMEAAIPRTDLQQRAGYQIRYLYENALCSAKEPIGHANQGDIVSAKEPVRQRSWRLSIEDHTDTQSVTNRLINGQFSRPLRIFCRNRCSNLRDKVYGLLAIAPPISPLTVDYRKPVEDVFYDAVHSIALEQARLLYDTVALPIFEITCDLCCIMANEMLEVVFPKPPTNFLRGMLDHKMTIEQYLAHLIWDEVSKRGFLYGPRKNRKFRLQVPAEEIEYANLVVDIYRGQLKPLL